MAGAGGSTALRSHSGRASKIRAHIGLLRAGEEPARFAASVRALISRPKAAPAQSRSAASADVLQDAEQRKSPQWADVELIRRAQRQRTAVLIVGEEIQNRLAKLYALPVLSQALVRLWRDRIKPSCVKLCQLMPSALDKACTLTMGSACRGSLSSHISR